MPAIQAILKAPDVDLFLLQHELVHGFVPITTVLLGHGGMPSGQPTLMLVIEVDGKKVLAKTSLQLMETICSSMRAACGLPRGP